MYPSDEMAICDKLAYKCTKMITLLKNVFLQSYSLKHLFYQKYFTYIQYRQGWAGVLSDTQVHNFLGGRPRGLWYFELIEIYCLNLIVKLFHVRISCES